MRRVQQLTGPLSAGLCRASVAVCAAVCLTVYLGCATPEPQAEVKAEAPPKPDPSLVFVRAVTDVPREFQRGMDKVNPVIKQVAIPSGLVSVRTVMRPKAELRAGPGTEFQLGDRLLTRGTKVLVLEVHDVWRKVVDIHGYDRGWVHNGILGDEVAASDAWRLPIDLLPTVIAMKPVTTVHSFPEKKPVKVNIPKGAIFHLLKQEPEQTLVWLSGTNSVMWMAGGDVQ